MPDEGGSRSVTIINYVTALDPLDASAQPSRAVMRDLRNAGCKTAALDVSTGPTSLVRQAAVSVWLADPRPMAH